MVFTLKPIETNHKRKFGKHNNTTFFDCSRWQTSTILDLLGAYLDINIVNVLNGLYNCAKVGCDRCSSFNNRKVSVFGMLT